MMAQDQHQLSRSGRAPGPGALLQEVLSRPWGIALVLALVTFAVFRPVVHHDFVNYDDPDYVTANPHVQSGLTWANVGWAMTSGHASNWHPLTWISHMVDCQVFGQQPGGHHLVNLGLHIGNSLILFLLLRRLTKAHWRSAFVAGVFALHPLHVESVAWISERKDVLSTLFFLLTIGAYAQWKTLKQQQELPKGRAGGGKTTKAFVGKAQCEGGKFTQHPARYYGLALVLYALGLMSKPMLVTLPFVLLLLDYWPLERIKVEAVRFQTLRLLVWEKVPFFALSLLSSVVTFLVQRQGGAVSTALTLGERVANALVAYVRYLGKTFWPENLSVLYPHPGQWPAWAVWGATLLLLALSAAVVWQARRRAYLIVGWLWFLGTLIPVIGLVQVGIQSMADRYSYVPMIGLLLAVAWGVSEIIPPQPWRYMVVTLGSVVSLGACAVLTARQVQYWQNSEALFRHAVQVTPRNYLAYNNLGFYLSNRGQVAEAIENYQKSLEINPAYEDALNNLGYALAGQKKPLAAIPYYEAALRVRPEHLEVHNNLGNALSDLGRMEEAIQHYRFVLRRKPEHEDAHNNLGIALAMKGQLEEAVRHFQDAIRHKPNYASAHSNLGNAYAVQRRFVEAIKEFEESLRLNPKDAQAHNNLANVMTELGRLNEAIEHYQEALRLNSNNPEAHFNLGLTLARQGKREEAVAHFSEALRLKPDYSEAQAQLSSAMARNGPAQ